MPNHITNKIQISGPEEDLSRFLSTHFTDKTGHDIGIAFDFNTVIPRPESLELPSGSFETAAIGIYHYANGDKGARLRQLHPYQWANELAIEALVERLVKNHLNETATDMQPEVVRGFDDLVRYGEQYVDNQRKYGHSTWYGWCCHNWGTKWNAYDQSEVKRRPGVLEFQFDTAWSMPKPIFESLAKMYPDCEIVVQFADEDLGHNCGVIFWKGDFSRTFEAAVAFAAVLKDGHLDRLSEWAADEMEEISTKKGE